MGPPSWPAHPPAGLIFAGPIKSRPLALSQRRRISPTCVAFNQPLECAELAARTSSSGSSLPVHGARPPCKRPSLSLSLSTSFGSSEAPSPGSRRSAPVLSARFGWRRSGGTAHRAPSGGAIGPRPELSRQRATLLVGRPQSLPPTSVKNASPSETQQKGSLGPEAGSNRALAGICSPEW